MVTVKSDTGYTETLYSQNINDALLAVFTCWKLLHEKGKAGTSLLCKIIKVSKLTHAHERRARKKSSRSRWRLAVTVRAASLESVVPGMSRLGVQTQMEDGPSPTHNDKKRVLHANNNF